VYLVIKTLLLIGLLSFCAMVMAGGQANYAVKYDTAKNGASLFRIVNFEVYEIMCIVTDDGGLHKTIYVDSGRSSGWYYVPTYSWSVECN